MTLRITNATSTPVQSYAGVVRPPEIARLLDTTRRSSLAGERVKAAFATFIGEVRVPKQPLRIEAALRVEGELHMPGRAPVPFKRVLGDGQPLSFEVHAEGSGEPELDVRALPAPVVNLLRPPRAHTWAEAVRRSPIPGSELLSRLLGARLRLVRADQFQTFLANPDADQRSRTVYDYERVGSTVPKRVVTPGRGGDGSDVLLIVFVVVCSVVALGGGLVAWARS